MGTNIFVEGLPKPVVIFVKLGRGVENFRELKEVLDALALIERLAESHWPREFEGLYPRARRRRHVTLLNFSVTSPPEFKIFADPAWVAIFVAVVIGYKDIRESIKLMHDDIGNVADIIEGLSSRQIQLLEIAIRLYGERIAKQGDVAVKKMGKKLQRAKRSLTGKEGLLPRIKIISIDDSDKWI